MALEATWLKIHEFKQLGDQFLKDHGQIDKCEMPPGGSRSFCMALVTQLQQELDLAKTAFDAKQTNQQIRWSCGLLLQQTAEDTSLAV